MSQTVLIGASDPNIAYLLQRYAEASGHAFAHAGQSILVPDRTLTLQPVVVILDLELVEATHWEVVRRLKADPATCHIPIVIYSCLDEPPEQRHEGVAGYLFKSVMYNDFVAMLERVCRKPPVGEPHPSAP